MRDPALSSFDEGRPGCAQGRLFIRSTVLLHKDFVLKRFCIPPPPPIGNGITWRKYGSVGCSDPLSIRR